MISDKILDKLCSIEGAKKLSEVETKVTKYLLNELFIHEFGKIEFSDDEIEIMNLKDKILISTIYNENIYEFSLESHLLICKDFLSVEYFLNHIHGIIYHNTEVYEYIIEPYDEYFTYYRGIKKDIVNFQFIGMMKSLMSKFKNKEMFELVKVLPKEEKEHLFFKRIILPSSRGNVVSIVTDYDLCDIFDYIDKIFDKLKEADEKIKKLNNLQN